MILPDDFNSSINNLCWPGVFISNMSSEKEKGDSRWGIPEYLFNNILWGQLRGNFIGCKVD